MNNQNNINAHQSKKKSVNLDLIPENSGRRSFIMIFASLIVAPYIYRGSKDNGSNISMEFTKRTGVPANLADVTVDSTHVAIGANGHQGIKIS